MAGHSMEMKKKRCRASILRNQFAVVAVSLLLQLHATTVNAVNSTPSATAQSVSGNEDQSLSITLAGSDPEGSSLTYALASNPSHGSASLSGNTVTYTPAANYNGTDSFTFTVSDGAATSSAATVSITINAVSDTPSATAQSVSGNEDAAQSITLAGSDPEGGSLTYALASATSHGSASLSGNTVTYTPPANYNGTDSFTFTVSNGTATSSAATVSITINAVNDTPSATAQSVSGNEDAAKSITLAGSNPDGGNVTYALASNPSHGNASLSGNTVTYTPAANYNGRTALRLQYRTELQPPRRRRCRSPSVPPTARHRRRRRRCRATRNSRGQSPWRVAIRRGAV